MPAHPGGPSPMAAPRSKAYLALLLFVFAAAALVTGGAYGWRPGGGSGGGDELEWHKPGFCGKMDCPRFTVWQKSYDFQHRRHQEALWVATNVSALRYEAAVKQAVPLLWDYFWGCNNESLRLRETVPLGVHYRTDLHPHTGERRNYTVAMYLPYLFQDGEPAPAPNNSAVWLLRHPAMDVFVRMFTHCPSEERVQAEAEALAQALEHAGHSDFEPTAGSRFGRVSELAQNPGELAVASYDHPHKHFPRRHKYRHSEVWIRGTGSNRSTSAAAGLH